jgi:hypothetical protein
LSISRKMKKNMIIRTMMKGIMKWRNKNMLILNLMIYCPKRHWLILSKARESKTIDNCSNKSSSTIKRINIDLILII